MSGSLEGTVAAETEIAPTEFRRPVVRRLRRPTGPKYGVVMRVDMRRVGSLRVRQVAVPTPLSGEQGSVQQPVPPVHLLAIDDRPLCNLSSQPMIHLAGMSWTGIGMHEWWCSDCEAIRQAD